MLSLLQASGFTTTYKYHGTTVPRIAAKLLSLRSLTHSLPPHTFIVSLPRRRITPLSPPLLRLLSQIGKQSHEWGEAQKSTWQGKLKEIEGSHKEHVKDSAAIGGLKPLPFEPTLTRPAKSGDGTREFIRTTSRFPWRDEVAPSNRQVVRARQGVPLHDLVLEAADACRNRLAAAPVGVAASDSNKVELRRDSSGAAVNNVEDNIPDNGAQSAHQAHKPHRPHSPPTCSAIEAHNGQRASRKYVAFLPLKSNSA